MKHHEFGSTTQWTEESVQIEYTEETTVEFDSAASEPASSTVIKSHSIQFDSTQTAGHHQHTGDGAVRTKGKKIRIEDRDGHVTKTEYSYDTVKKQTREEQD